ncbi:Hypothetical protein NTJ_06540 [Nesidiocoris tenuis]|uniref:Uncharacterized protein n=1 Tax=Nesidiocoris tenuis TaxID=355587 RepID=A0ABN7ANB9_9HEMI|nr:Hypothetical protein NTJ_06540 [Nesidiocoris tenuis]
MAAIWGRQGRQTLRRRHRASTCVSFEGLLANSQLSQRAPPPEIATAPSQLAHNHSSWRHRIVPISRLYPAWQTDPRG